MFMLNRRLTRISLALLAASALALPGFNTGASAFDFHAAAPQVKTVGIAAPTFSPAGGTYAAAQTVRLTSATPGAVMCYSTNGIAPNSASCTRYTGPITVAKSEIVKAIAVASGRVSGTSSATYTIN